MFSLKQHVEARQKPLSDYLQTLCVDRGLQKSFTSLVTAGRNGGFASFEAWAIVFSRQTPFISRLLYLLRNFGLLRRKLEIGPGSKVFRVWISSFCREQRVKSKIANLCLECHCWQNLKPFSEDQKFVVLQISNQVRTDLRFCREWHSRQRFFMACFCCALDDKNLKFTPEKPSNQAPISRFSSHLIGNL
jgi:hypothetical protein